MRLRQVRGTSIFSAYYNATPWTTQTDEAEQPFREHRQRPTSTSRLVADDFDQLNQNVGQRAQLNSCEEWKDARYAERWCSRLGFVSRVGRASQIICRSRKTDGS